MEITHEELTKAFKYGYETLAAGTVDFYNFRSELVKKLGITFSEYILSVYNALRELPEIESSGISERMTSYKDIKRNFMEEQTLTLSDINIQRISDDIFTSYSVKKKRKDIVDYYTQKLGAGLFSTSEGIPVGEIGKRIDAILRDDRASQAPFLNYANSYYRKARRKGGTIDPLLSPDSNYMGKAGECLVMGELLFRGYNVNHMMVDEGIDLVASKNNVFYYIQVKTKNVDEQNRFYFQIKQDRFDIFIGTQIRYILVARCILNKENRVIFFKFNNDDIQRFCFGKCIPKPSNGSGILSIKIRHDDRTDKFYIYDGKNEEDISFNTNNLTL